MKTCENHKKIMSEDLVGYGGNVAKTDITLEIDEKNCEYCDRFPRCTTCFQFEKTGKHYENCPSK